MRIKKKHMGYLVRDLSIRKKMKVVEWILRHNKLWGPYPLYAKVEVDQRCNLNCEMCQRNQVVDNAYLTVDQFKEIIDKLGPGLSQVDIHGYGESLINPDYIEMLRYLKEKRILISVVTNGTLLDTEEKRRELLELKPRRVRFSIEAADKETYERIRRGANFESVKESFMELVRIRDELYPEKDRNNPVIDIYCTITTQLTNQIGPMVKLKDEWGADYLTFSDIAWNNQFGTSTFENCIRESLTNSEIDELESLYKDRRDIVFHLKNEGYRACDRPASHVYVDANGFIYPCTCTPSFEKDILPFGNIFEIDDIREIYQSEIYDEFRRRSELGILNDKSCRRCLEWGPSLDKI